MHITALHFTAISYAKLFCIWVQTTSLPCCVVYIGEWVRFKLILIGIVFDTKDANMMDCTALKWQDYTALHWRQWPQWTVLTSLHCTALHCTAQSGIKCTNITAVHQNVSKYLTAQDTHISPTLTKNSRTLLRHGNLLSLQSQSTIQEYKAFSDSSTE